MTYRRIRSDFWDHPKTRGLSPLARDLFLQAVTSSLLGISERSTKQLARRAGVKPADVSAALDELTGRKLAVWWTDLEILWVIEGIDENLDGPRAKSAAARAAEALPEEVREAISERYPWIREVPNSATGVPILPVERTGSETGAGVEQPRHTFRLIGRDDKLLDAINESLCVTIGPEQHGRFYTSAAERVADGVTITEIREVLDKWKADDRSKRPDRRRLFYAKQWEWTRKRYLCEPKPVPTESPGEALHGHEPVAPEKVSEIVGDLAKRWRTNAVEE